MTSRRAECRSSTRLVWETSLVDVTESGIVCGEVKRTLDSVVVCGEVELSNVILGVKPWTGCV